MHSVVWEARFRYFPAEIKVADWSAFASLSSRYSRQTIRKQEMEVAESCTAAPYIQYIKKKKKNTLDKLKLNSNYSKKTSNLDLKKNTNSYFISIFNLTWLLFQS